LKFPTRAAATLKVLFSNWLIMAALITALLAFVAVLAGGYLNNFLAEDFRRFRDSQALAGAFAGELESHGAATPYLRPRLHAMLLLVKEDKPLALHEMPKPTSPVFDANVERVGLLGPDIARDLVAVYEQINGFRAGFVMLSKHHSEMNQAWREAVLGECILRVDTASARGAGLLEKLNEKARADYEPDWPIFRKKTGR
jgi:hypothetical protein